MQIRRKIVSVKFEATRWRALRWDVFFLMDFTDTGSSTTRKFGEPRNVCGNAVLPTSIRKLLFIPANDVTFYKDSFPWERRARKLCLHILRSRVNIAEKIKSRNVSSLWTICLSEQEIIWLSASLQPRFRKVSNPSEFRLFKRHNPISYALYRVMYPIADTCFFLKLEITGLVDALVFFFSMLHFLTAILDLSTLSLEHAAMPITWPIELISSVGRPINADEPLCNWSTVKTRCTRSSACTFVSVSR